MERRLYDIRIDYRAHVLAHDKSPSRRNGNLIISRSAFPFPASNLGFLAFLAFRRVIADLPAMAIMSSRVCLWMCLRLTISHEARLRKSCVPPALSLPSIRLLQSRDTYWQNKPAKSKYIDLTAIQIISFAYRSYTRVYI